MHEDYYLEAARGNDFIGVQAYTRIRIGLDGLPMEADPDVAMIESMGYEYWPQSLEAAIRHAIDVTGCPVYVTENGIGIDDDAVRVKFVTESLEGMARCLADGLDIRGYIYWSLLDNFEWAEGYKPRFGLVERRSGDLRAHTETECVLARQSGEGQLAPVGCEAVQSGPRHRVNLWSSR